MRHNIDPPDIPNWLWLLCFVVVCLAIGAAADRLLSLLRALWMVVA